MAPAILRDVPRSARTFTDELFAPVAALSSFDSVEEGLTLANDTSAGLAAYLFTQDLDLGWEAAGRLRCGMVGVNEGAISTETAPFGGVKQSGLGREGGPDALDAFTVVKSVCFGPSRTQSDRRSA
jgi:acyl-CoA reductase-like NAD-dependent aldehyde dehydrogenase